MQIQLHACDFGTLLRQPRARCNPLLPPAIWRAAISLPTSIRTVVKICTKDGNFWLSRVAGAEMMWRGDDVAFMYDTDLYATGDCLVLDVNRVNMVEFEGDAPNSPTYTQSCVSLGNVSIFCKQERNVRRIYYGR